MKKPPSKRLASPFVMLLIEIVDAPAWRAMSHGAKVLYIALRRRHNATIDNNGKIYLSQRAAAKELGSNRRYIACWFTELEHYGFIVLTSAGHLGVNGRGRAPSWRLTELSCKDKPATKDYLGWNGAQKKEARPTKVVHPGPQKWAKGTGDLKVPPWPTNVVQKPGPQKWSKYRVALHKR
jgi:hypothetical protein